MVATAHHTITVCTDCRRLAPEHLASDAIFGLLREQLDAGSSPGRGFTIRGTPCLAACDHPCAVAFQADGKASYLFGHISAHADVAALAEFADLYAGRADGMSRQCERPRALARKTLARIPCLAANGSENAHEL